MSATLLLSTFKLLPSQGPSQYEFTYADPSSGLVIGFLPKTKERNFRTSHFIGEWDVENKCMKDIPSKEVVDLSDFLKVKRHTHECIYDLILKDPRSDLAITYCEFQTDDGPVLHEPLPDLEYLIFYKYESPSDLVYLFAYCLNNNRLDELSNFIKITHIPITTHVCRTFVFNFPSYALWKKLYPALGVSPIKIFSRSDHHINMSLYRDLIVDIGLDKISEYIREDREHHYSRLKYQIHEYVGEYTLKSAQQNTGLICPIINGVEDETDSEDEH